MTHRKTSAVLALAMIACLSGAPASAIALTSPLADAPRTPQQAVKRLGQPSVRETLPGGGQRLRWVSVDASALSILRLTTLEYDASGRLTSSDSRRLMSPLASGKGV